MIGVLMTTDWPGWRAGNAMYTRASGNISRYLLDHSALGSACLSGPARIAPIQYAGLSYLLAQAYV